MAALEAAVSCRPDLRRSVWAFAFGVGLLVAPLTSAAQSGGDDSIARKLFTEGASPPCALCHELAAAGTAGKIGPSLDELKPDADRVARAIKQGVGVMPPYEESLTSEQISVLARYVARTSGASK
jgi:sulfite dehydrogenase